MDSSIEIIGEIFPKTKDLVTSSKSSFSNEVEVIYTQNNECSSNSSKEIHDLTSTVGIGQRKPVRKRKVIKSFSEEQDELFKSKKRRKSTANRRPLLKLCKKSPKLNKLKVSKASKNDSIQILKEVKKIEKAPRAEAGGAGTMNARHKKSKTLDNDIEIVFEWDPAVVISERQGIEEWQTRNVLKLFDQENTLPFIARYRKEKTGNMEVEKIREIQNTYSQIRSVQEKVTKILKSDSASVVPKILEERRKSLLSATTLQEVELLTAFMKTSGNKSYADRARDVGLHIPCVSILEGSLQYSCRESLNAFLDYSREGLQSIEDIEQGVSYILADVISKDPEVLEFVRKLMRTSKPHLECCRKKVAKSKSESKSKSSTVGPSDVICDKYKNYFNFVSSAWNLRPHQVLAINRGENQNVLRVKVLISDEARLRFIHFNHQKWLKVIHSQQYQSSLIIKSIEDCWERLVKPFMQRHIRSQLTETAEIASIEVFTANLRKLLLTPPLRGKTVLAIDPGFLNGCKIGVTNPKGEILLTTTIYPFQGKEGTKKSLHWSKDHNAMTLREIVSKYNCELIAIGNGTACREMEQYLTQLISNKCFEPQFNVQYTIINESGASQYSVSPEARTEFPDLDPNHISAVSLARRLQDPLLEYVKVHPMHLGVGMYQHDIPEKLLHASLDSVMVECVSFVGIDINVASEFVLRKLSGLNKTRAANIVEHRKTKGLFSNREQIKSVKGIGPKTFEQCAGFIKILPSTLEEELSKTASGKRKAITDVNPLDKTTIHPESYGHANKLMQMAGVRSQDIGTESFIQKIRNFSQNSSLQCLSEDFGISIHTMQLILEGISQPMDFDLRAQFAKPLFRKGVTSINDIVVGTQLTGTVRNMTHFGAFVDVGLGVDGLIHQSKMNGMRIELGNNVEVFVESLEKLRKRIGLRLERVL